MRETKFLSNGWDDYLYWQSKDKKVLKKLNKLIKECQRHPFEGIGKPEALKYEFTGLWSRRINKEHRLIYEIKNDLLIIHSLKGHYQ